MFCAYTTIKKLEKNLNPCRLLIFQFSDCIFLLYLSIPAKHFIRKGKISDKNKCLSGVDAPEGNTDIFVI